jgi:hypothetical protein
MPIELLRHLAQDELRWLEWRFADRDDTGQPLRRVSRGE